MYKRIEVNPTVCHGKSMIRGTRILVRNIIGVMTGGDSINDILNSYPELTREDVKATVAYAIELVDDTQLSIKVPAGSKFCLIRISPSKHGKKLLLLLILIKFVFR